MSEHHDVVRREFARQADGFGHRASFFAFVLDRGVGRRRCAAGRRKSSSTRAAAPGTCRARWRGGRGSSSSPTSPTSCARPGATRPSATAWPTSSSSAPRSRTLPFADRSFDAVLCRFVVHHLSDPAPALAELARVCRPAGRVVVADLVALDDEIADRQNGLERLRDPSHTTALTADGLEAALTAGGLEVDDRDAVDRTLDAEPWLERAHTPPDGAAEVRAALAAEAAGGPRTGLRAARGQDGVLRVGQRWLRLVARPV